MTLRLFSFRFIAPVVLFVFLFAALLAGRVQNQSKAPPTERADAVEVRERIASGEELLPQFVDRGAALYYLALLKQHLGETREALKLLKECLTLREGFDPSGSRVFGVLMKDSKELD